MLARQRTKANQKAAQRAVLLAAKARLKDRGWTYRTAAPRLGVCYTHLCRVLVGLRQSQSLLRRIDELPPKENPSTSSAA